MKHTKRWLAALLAVTMTLSDCGGMTVLATENTAALEEDSVSDNNVGISDEFIPEDETGESDDNDVISLDPSGDTENIKTDSDADTAAELPALHIGQIKKGEELPSPDDDEFLYDLPVSFETSDQIILFSDYNLTAILEEGNGALVWSILRGEKGLDPGTASLLDEEDDWTGFETVSSSPFFVMEEITDEESEYFQMMLLTPAEISSIVDNIESYDYYIRAAYYPKSENEKTEEFYAAATIPFLPQKNASETQDETADGENAQTDILPDDMTSEDPAASEEPQDDALTDAETTDTESDGEETDMEQTSEESVSENSVTSELLSALSENEDEGDVPPTNASFGVLTLDAENVTLHIGKTSQIRATLEPKNIDAKITWTSSDPAIVSVSTDTSDVEKANDSSYIANMEALQAGTAQITAKCGDDLTATVKVNVIAADENEVYDLSGDIWVSGFKKDDKSLVYTGQKVTQDFQVYYKETLLKEKTDYTLTYKNNVNAAKSNDVKAPNVTITMKGQYQGSATLYYTINPASIQGLAIYNASQDNADETDGEAETPSGYKQTINYSTNLKFPTPELLFGKKKLAANKDFVCDYTPLPDQLWQMDYKKGDSYILGKTYYYNVDGKGNFEGTVSIPFVVVDKTQNFSSATVKLNAKQYAYPLTSSNVKIEKITLNRQTLNPDYYNYDVYATEIDGAYIMVYPTPAGENAGYRGFKKVALKLVGDRKISDAVLGAAWKESIPFSQKTVNEAGGIFQNENGELLTFVEGNTKEALTEGQDYTVKYTNAKKVGTVTATFTGKGRYKGTLKKKYTITPNTEKKNFTIRWKNVTREGGALVIAYQKGGAIPDFVLLDQDNNVLKNKTDYTVKLKDNKAPGNMSCEITGKGNYKGYTETVHIMVKNGNIRQCTLSVPDKPYSTKANAWKSKVTVKDVNGKTLTAGTDYEKEVSYSYPGYTGTENEHPAEGTTVTVTVKGMGFYANDNAADSSRTGSYRIFQNNISKLKIVIDNQEYTGKEIILSPVKDIHVYATAADKKAKKELEDAASCYQIVEYKNNIKAGTAKVTLRGIGDYGGTKTYSFKILKKAYLTNRVARITLDQKNLNISIAEKGQRTLTATITPKDASQQLTNPTVNWTTSNNNIATVKPKEPAPDDQTDARTETDNSISVTADITVKKAGTVNITAIAQDGNKKAVCTVKITVPALKEKNQTIRCKTGDTYQLSFQNINSEIDWTSFKFKSTNLKVASVTENGLVTMERFGMATIQVSVGSSVQQCSFVVERVSDDELDESKGVLTYEQQSGCKDDTAAINALLQKAENNPGMYDTVYIPNGTYHINPFDPSSGFGGIILRNNQNLIMAKGATLEALSNGYDGYHIIWACGRSNVTISGGKIVGDRNTHKGSSGEWGHGIQISGCKNVYISDVEVSNCWGDGIYLGFNDQENACSNGVTIENCNLHHNRRNNLSITDASNVTIRNCQFNNANGTDPQYGIDIEPNAGRPCKTIRIYDSTFKGNAKASMGIMTSASDIRLENCTLDGQFINWSGTNVVLKNTTVKGGVTGQNAGNVKYE